MKLVRQKDSRELKERQRVVKKSNKGQGMGDVLVELVWGDFKFPKGAIKLKNTLSSYSNLEILTQISAIVVEHIANTEGAGVCFTVE